MQIHQKAKRIGARAGPGFRSLGDKTDREEELWRNRGVEVVRKPETIIRVNKTLIRVNKISANKEYKIATVVAR